MERALYDANEGVDDGNFVRTDELGDQYPNLIAVPEPVMQAEFVVFSKKASLHISGWNDLNQYNVGIIRGCKISENHLTRAKSVTRVKDLRLLMNLLVEDKVDVVVYDRIHGKVFLDKINQHGIHVARRPLAKKDMYLYLHKKHRDLAPLLAETIRSMKHDGAYQSIYNDVMKSYSL
jgi:polar amino acid transport system substrate-binding protein